MRLAPARARLSRAALTALIGATIACGSEPARPSRVNPTLLRISCPPPTSADVKCTAVLFEPGSTTEDVTASATWTVAPQAVGGYVTPGLLRPVARGEIQVFASHNQWSDTGPKFLVDPNEVARWLYFGQFTAVEEDMTTRVPGVNVVLTSGYRTGWSCVTNMFGICTIDDLLTLEEFQAAATKDGYQPTAFSQTFGPPFNPYPFPGRTVVMRRK